MPIDGGSRPNLPWHTSQRGLAFECVLCLLLVIDLLFGDLTQFQTKITKPVDPEAPTT